MRDVVCCVDTFERNFLSRLAPFQASFQQHFDLQTTNNNNNTIWIDCPNAMVRTLESPSLPMGGMMMMMTIWMKYWNSIAWFCC